jgi:hypothetical protein
MNAWRIDLDHYAIKLAHRVVCREASVIGEFQDQELAQTVFPLSTELNAMIVCMAISAMIVRTYARTHVWSVEPVCQDQKEQVFVCAEILLDMEAISAMYAIKVITETIVNLVVPRPALAMESVTMDSMEQEPVCLASLSSEEQSVSTVPLDYGARAARIVVLRAVCCTGSAMKASKAADRAPTANL